MQNPTPHSIGKRPHLGQNEICWNSLASSRGQAATWYSLLYLSCVAVLGQKEITILWAVYFILSTTTSFLRNGWLVYV